MFGKRTSNDKLIEIKIQKIYLYNNIFGGYRCSNYSIKTFFDISSFWFPISNSGLYNEIQVEKIDIRLIDGLIYQIPEIREFSRNKKIENILN